MRAPGNRVVVVHLSLSMRGEVTDEMTLLKVTARSVATERPFDTTPIKLHEAWVRSSTGTTAGKLIRTDAGESSYYLGVAAGDEVFVAVIEGLITDGLTVGYNLRPGGLDTVTVVKEPPTSEAGLTEFRACLKRFRENLQKATKGTDED